MNPVLDLTIQHAAGAGCMFQLGSRNTCMNGNITKNKGLKSEGQQSHWYKQLCQQQTYSPSPKVLRPN
jgi:hypothetical protein